MYKASIESLYASLGAQGPGFVPTRTTIQHYDAGNNKNGDYVFDQQGTMTIGEIKLLVMAVDLLLTNLVLREQLIID